MTGDDFRLFITGFPNVEAVSDGRGTTFLVSGRKFAWLSADLSFATLIVSKKVANLYENSGGGITRYSGGWLRPIQTKITFSDLLPGQDVAGAIWAAWNGDASDERLDAVRNDLTRS